MQKLAHNDAGNWYSYLPATLFAYCLSIYCITKFSSFAMLYGQEASNHSLLSTAVLKQEFGANYNEHLNN